LKLVYGLNSSGLLCPGFCEVHPLRRPMKGALSKGISWKK
jgi:hypothetical protein